MLGCDERPLFDRRDHPRPVPRQVGRNLHSIRTARLTPHPRSLAPLYLQRTDLDMEDFTLPSLEDMKKAAPHGLEVLLHKSLLSDPKYVAFLSLLDKLQAASKEDKPQGLASRLRALGSGHWAAKLARAKDGLPLRISPAHPVNLSPSAREEAIIPAHAQDFIFCYPLDHYQISVAELEVGCNWLTYALNSLHMFASRSWFHISHIFPKVQQRGPF